MHKYDKVRKIVKGSQGTGIQITPMDMSKFMNTYKNIDPSLIV
jgi:hypothetical protein